MALPLVAITAWEALVDRCCVKPGDHVLIHGGAGGVGHVAIQIAKARPVLDEQRFSLFDVGAAHAHLESGKALGKIVIDIADSLDAV